MLANWELNVFWHVSFWKREITDAGLWIPLLTMHCMQQPHCQSELIIALFNMLMIRFWGRASPGSSSMAVALVHASLYVLPLLQRQKHWFASQIQCFFVCSDRHCHGNTREWNYNKVKRELVHQTVKGWYNTRPKTYFISLGLRQPQTLSSSVNF